MMPSKDRPTGNTPRRCAKCGWEWFHLVDDDLPNKVGVVAVNEDGNIDAYAGAFECAKCRKMLDDVPFSPGSGTRLRLCEHPG